MGQAYFAAEAAYDIAGGDYRQRLPIARCQTCGHGTTDHGVPAATITDWYRRQTLDTVFLSDEVGRRQTADHVLERIERLVDRRGRLLDVGAGPGLFVLTAHERGWQADGIELAEAARAWLQREHGFHLRAGGIETLASLPAASYDVVTLFDVIEHVTDPVAALREIHRVLLPGGLLVLTTPKFDSFMARLFKSRWYSIFPAHLQYFTRASLTFALTAACFRPSVWRQHVWRMSLGYIVWRFLGWIAPTRQRKHVPPRGVWRLVVPLSNGDEFEVYARKK